MNICFIACFNKTIFFYKISEELRKEGINVFWISVSKKWTKYLIDNGTQRGNILQLSYNEVSLKNMKVIQKMEEESAHTLKQVYYMDRVLCEQPWEKVSKLFSYIISNAEKFLEINDIKVVFGETTAAHEILISMLTKSIGKRYFKPHTIRMPDNRFAFFDGHLEDNIFKLKCDDFTYEDSCKYLTNYKLKKTKPYYFTIHNKNSNYLKLDFYTKKMHKIKDIYFESKTNFSEKSIYHHLFIEKKYMKPFNKYRIKKSINFHTIKKKGKYVLFTMHVQPEASIDVLGIENNNQYELIKTLATNLPFEYTLLVKEHSNALGLRNKDYLKSIEEIPGVLLVDPLQDTTELLEYVDLTYTVSGTIGIEASILGKKSVSLAPMFYNILPNSFFDKNPLNIKKYLNVTCAEDSKILENAFFQYIQYTHKGFISDPISLPHCISKENIIDVSRAFLKLLKSL
jgi:hypothetical protein